MQYHEMSCNIIQCHAISYNIMKYHKMSCNIMQYHKVWQLIWLSKSMLMQLTQVWVVAPLQMMMMMINDDDDDDDDGRLCYCSRLESGSPSHHHRFITSTRKSHSWLQFWALNQLWRRWWWWWWWHRWWWWWWSFCRRWFRALNALKAMHTMQKLTFPETVPGQ